MDARDQDRPTELPSHQVPVGRGVFLATVGAGVSSLLWGKAAWNRVSGVVTPLAADIAPILPTSGWRIYSVADHLPTFDAATWRLSVGGLVDRPLQLDYASLRSLPRAEQVSTFHCVTGWTVNGVHWAGVRIDDLIRPAGPSSRAGALRFVS